MLYPGSVVPLAMFFLMMASLRPNLFRALRLNYSRKNMPVFLSFREKGQTGKGSKGGLVKDHTFPVFLVHSPLKWNILNFRHLFSGRQFSGNKGDRTNWKHIYFLTDNKAPLSLPASSIQNSPDIFTGISCFQIWRKGPGIFLFKTHRDDYNGWPIILNN